MKKLFVNVMVSIGLMVSLPAIAQSGNVDAGKEKTATCAACHGADGNSAAPNFPKLAGQGAKYLIKQMQDVKAGNRQIVEMTGLLDGLNEQDFADIAAYYEAQAISIGQANKDLVASGEALYRVGNPATNVAACTACHGPTGTGMALAAFPALGGQHAAYTEAQLKKFRSGERANDGDARIMRSIAAKLSDKEIKALASYISGLHK